MSLNVGGQQDRSSDFTKHISGILLVSAYILLVSFILVMVDVDSASK